jgi:hypothetical protein
MKNTIIILILTICGLKTSAQIKHSFTNVIISTGKESGPIQYNRWYKKIGDEEIMYFHMFNQNTIGIKKALELTEEICLENDLDYDNPAKDKSYLASYVKSMSDFENLNLSISTGGSIIEKVWFNTNKAGKISILRIEFSEQGYAVTISNPK